MTTNAPAASLPSTARPPTSRRMLAFLRNLSPIGHGVTAFIQKELRVSGRRAGTYVTRSGAALGLVVLIGIVLSAFIDSFKESNSGASPAKMMQDFQRIAPVLTLAVLWFELPLMAFAAAFACGGTLCNEQRKGTLSALLTTPVSAGQIVLGKFIGHMTEVLIISLIPLPAILAIRTFGGVPADLLGAGMIVVLSTSIMAASIAILRSAWSKRATSAASGSIAVIMFLSAATASTLVLPRFVAGFSLPSWVLPVFCPPYALAMVSAAVVGRQAVDVWHLVLLSAGGSLSIAAITLVLASASLRRIMTAGERETTRRMRRADKQDAAAEPNAPAESEHAPGRKQRRRKVPRRRDWSSVREVGDRPVLWRELRLPIFKTKYHAAGLLIGLAALAAYISRELWPNLEGPRAIATAMGMFVFMMITSSATTSLVANEVEGRTWPVLLATPISPRDLMMGKLWGALRRASITPLLVVPFYVFAGAVSDTFTFIQLVSLVLIFASTGFFLLATGIGWSLLIKRAIGSSLANAGMALVLWVGPPIVLGITMNIGGVRGSKFEAALQYLVAATNPMVIAVTSSIELRRAGMVDWPGGDISQSHFLAIAVVVSAAYATLALLAIKLSSRVFNSLCDRPS